MTQHKYGEDFAPGELHRTGRITVTETHVVNWAGLTGDFYPLHMDRVYAEKTEFGERLAHGPLVFALAVGLVAQSGFGGDAAIAWLGANHMRMLAPVRIGDTVEVEVTVKERKPTRDPKRGVHTWNYRVLNQRGEAVMEFDFVLMLHQRGE